MEALRHYTMATSQNGWMDIWKKCRGNALDGDNWCTVLLGQVFVIPDGSTKEIQCEDLFQMFDTYKYLCILLTKC